MAISSPLSARLLVPICVLLVALAARSARAEPKARIVIVTAEPDSTTSQRLIAELRSMGLAVTTAPPRRDATRPPPLQEIAREYQAIAAVMVVVVEGKAELWIADTITNKTLLRELAVDAAASGRRDDSIVVGVAELLRASFIELDQPRPEKPTLAPVPLDVRRPVDVVEPRSSIAKSQGWLGFGASTAFGTRGLGPSLLGRVTGGWRSSRGLGAEAVASTTLVPAIVERAAIGRATISTQGFGGALLFAWPPAPARWSWFAGAGVLATRVEARGEPRPSFLGSTEAAWGVGPYISAGGSVTLFESLRLRLEAAALRTMNGPTIRFDESEVAIFGQPSLFVSLSLEATVAN